MHAPFKACSNFELDQVFSRLIIGELSNNGKRMKNKNILIVVMVLAMSFTAEAFAQNLMVYPAKGQSQEQMERDKFDCYSWAKKNTGFDPMQATPVQQQSVEQRGLLGGAARGAAGGAIIGAIAGDAGTGAAIGAGVGTVGRGMGNRRERNRAEQNQEQAQSMQDAARNDYNRAYAACLEGRGYTVR